MENNRSLSVDITKGTAIIAIVLGHIAFSYPSCCLVHCGDLVFGLWHVAVFFIVAGFFIKEEQLVQPKLWFKKKFSSLYLKVCVCAFHGSDRFVYCFLGNQEDCKD